MSGNKYRVTVTDANSISVQSNGSATLTVQVTPAFTTQPTGPTTTKAGTSFTTTPAVAASGSPTPTFKWQSAPGASGGTFTDVSGATGTTLTVASPVAGTIRYRAVATNAAGSANSNEITVVTT